MAKLVKSIYTGSVVTSLGETNSTDQLEGRYAVEIATLTDSATVTPDFGVNQNFTLTLGGNRILANPTNVVAGQTGSIFLEQDSVGSRTLSFGNAYQFPAGTAPTLTTTAFAVDRLDYIVRSTDSDLIHTVFTGAYA